MTSYLKTMLAGLRQWITAQKADWSQNDETAANYIKGRPCYEDDSGTVVPLPAKYLSTITAEKLPEIPAEKLPNIPASKITGGVKTINGVGPDSNGDVVIAAYSSEDDLPVIPVNKLNNIYKNIDETVSVPFDLSNVDGLDKFNIKPYGDPAYLYKITDELPNFSYVDSVSIKKWFSSGEFTYRYLKNSTDKNAKLICDEYAMYNYGYGFVFASKAGDITVSTMFDTTVTYNIPSPGLYVADNVLSLNYHIYSIRQGIYLNSSTDKKFLITVDDSGTISATEVTT